MYSLADMA